MKIFKIVFTVIGITIVGLIGFVFFLGYMFSAGTHGSIKSYQYPVSKEKLERAIDQVIQENKSVQRPFVDTSTFDVNGDNYFNTNGYITLTISAPNKYNYIFRFSGDEENWKSNPNNSEISICIASDNLGNGGSEGLGGVEWYRWGLKDKLTSYFEKNFIVKVDEKLGVTHTEYD